MLPHPSAHTEDAATFCPRAPSHASHHRQVVLRPFTVAAADRALHPVKVTSTSSAPGRFQELSAMSRKRSKHSRRPPSASVPAPASVAASQTSSASSEDVPPASGPVPTPSARQVSELPEADTSRPSNAPASTPRLSDQLKRAVFEAPAMEDAATSPSEPGVSSTGVEASAQDKAEEPAREAQREAQRAEEHEPGAKPAGDGAADDQPHAAHQDATQPQQGAEGQADADERERDGEEQRAQGGSHDEGERDEGESHTRDSATHDDGLHDEFFRKGEEVEKEHMAALAAAVNDERPGQSSDAPVTRSLPLDPAILARRARLRRVVAWVLGPAAIVAVIAGAKLASNANATTSDATASAVRPPPPRPLTTNPSRSTTLAPVRAPVLDVPMVLASASAPDPATSAPPEDSAAASSAPPAASDVTAGVTPAVDVAAAKKQALKLLNQGKFKDAVPIAESALAADPTDANIYLYLGTALEELGRRKEAAAVYSRCVHEASKGPKHECRALGGK